ncbi:MAG: winged helix-turn-helix domain-containing protein [Actinomycetota bacterium]
MYAGRPFVGRTDDATRVADLLDQGRMVTVVGPGGVGKTTLALAVGDTVADGYPGGVLVAELAGLGVDDDLEVAVARLLGVDSIDALTLRAAGRRTLLILDNCESTPKQAAALAEDLLTRSDCISVLATGRSPLYAATETIVTLEPLSMPSAAAPAEEVLAADAVDLFLQLATAAGVPWTATSIDPVVLTRLVHQLDGLPLAIELAAARCRVVTPSDLVKLLDQQVDVLSRPGPAEGRHDNLRRAIRTSYEPLGDNSRRFFRQLSVIGEPFPLDLAHRVAGDGVAELGTLEMLTELIDSSLISVRTDDEGRARYRLLETIRAFGREQLEAHGELLAAGDRYAEAMAGVADDLVAAALASFTPEVLGQIRHQFAHLADAVRWCLEHDDGPDRAYRLFLPFYGPTGARAEVAELAGRVQERWEEEAPLQAEAWAVMGTATFLNGEYELGAALSAKAVAHPESTSMAQLMANRTLGYLASLQGDAAKAGAHLEAAIEAAATFSASFTRELHISRAVVIDDPAQSPEALAGLRDVSRQAATHNEIVNLVWSEVAAAYHHNLLGDHGEAERAARTAVTVADRSGLYWTVSTAHRTLGAVLAHQEGWEAARPHFLTAFSTTLEVGDIEGIAMALRAASGAARHCGEHDVARELWSSIPPVRGLPVVRSLFHDQEEELLAEFGTPPPLDRASSADRARRLLSGVGGHPTPDGGTARAAPLDAGPAHGESVVGAPTAAAGGGVVRFGPFELDHAMHELRKEGERVHIEPQVFDVLALLIARRGAVVSREEVLDEVWGDRFVSVAALSSRIAAARKATDDDGKRQTVIRTVHGKGFTFVAPVEGD